VFEFSMLGSTHPESNAFGHADRASR